MRGRLGRGRGGPGLLGTMARTAVVAGTASSVAGRVTARQQAAAQQAGAQRPPVQQQPKAADTGAASGVDHLHSQLTKLGELRQSGLLTDEEFAAQKARLLRS
ncbi:SHOCT domain-containing protein [Geodermatophilus sabuli]|uniref:Short C-terminal domain-containing protein n=1 Tax=Geodermatophilus sabuli TaxID=1564158 RepID=A0A285EK18_9ACTN|nr:SHOCT domain-containing protein [Geodermatophilus sabuli]MBB3083775.1 hypothetical protein [Geodermatophilus sabuli]SNX99203.1 Short C-terminal domain-containing protein [Geodermatophilus sabuli]